MATTTAHRGKNGRFENTTKSDSNFGLIAGAAAGGLALGVLAMLGRKAAVQAPTALAGNWDEALKLEHAATLKVFDLMEATDETNTIKRGMLLSHLKHALMKHAIEEENVIYPALRDAGEVDAADELNKEHGYVKQYLYELENTPNSSPAWIATLAKFRTDIEAHMREEEEILFPKLVAQLGEEKNKALTATMNKEGFKVA